MPDFKTRPPKYKPSKKIDVEWENFRKGLNQLLRPTELGRDELAVADNIMLVGEGVPTGRWGTSVYFSANATGSIRGIGIFRSNDASTNDVFALTDEGYLAKRDGTSYEVVTGQSWPSGSTIRSEQLGGKTYIVSEDVSFTQYDGTSLAVYATISAPTGLSVTNFSGATGTDSKSWKVVAIGPNGGQTTASAPYVLSNLPSDLTDSEYHLFWTAPSAASLSGFEIYRGPGGDETLLTTVDAGTTFFRDRGEATANTIFTPLSNTTGGVKSKFIKKYKDRLLVVDKDDPNKLMISGIYPKHTSFTWYDGGGYIYIDPDSGDNITGLEVQPIADRIIVYKERSSYLVELAAITAENQYILDPKYTPISTAVGCSSQDSIATVENDTFYFGRDGLYVTGYEPNFLNIIRTNEVSARIRPYIKQLSDADFTGCTALYIDNKYILSFPNKREMIVYDRERGAFIGPWKFPWGISHMSMYIDDSGNEKWLLGSSESNMVYAFDEGLNTDSGTAVAKTVRTNKDYLGDFTILNILRFFYTLFRRVSGTVTVNIIVEGRDGTTSTVKSFTISGSEVSGFTGWGMTKWGQAKWGQSESTTAVIAGEEITRWGSLFKQSRIVQVEVTTSSASSNFELLGIKITASPQTEGSLSSTQRV